MRRQWVHQYYCLSSFLLLFPLAICAAQESKRSVYIPSLLTQWNEANEQSSAQDFVRRSRKLTQTSTSSRSSDQAECRLEGALISSLYHTEDNEWQITDDALAQLDNDIQLVIECASENDVLLFQTTSILRPPRPLTLFTDLTLKGASQVQCTCPKDNEGLLIARTPSFSLINITIAGCNSTNDIIALDPPCQTQGSESRVLFDHVRFEDNEVSNGGRILSAGKASCSRLELNDFVVRGNRCDGVDCIFLSSLNNTLRNVQLLRNRGTDNSIFLASNNSMTVAQNVRSFRNKIRSFHVLNARLDMTDSEFVMNKRDQFSGEMEDVDGGSGLLMENSNCTISHSVFRNNSGANGGAIFTISSNLEVLNCRFECNRASSGIGGALLVYDGSQIEIRSSQFFKNEAGDEGGALYLFRASNLTLMDSIFTRNKGQIGAGLCIQLDSAALISSSNFTRNEAVESGGCVSTSRSSTTNFTNCRFINNRARDFGGVVVAFAMSSTSISDSVLSGNRADVAGTIFTDRKSKLTLSSVNFVKNEASHGGCLFVQSSCNVEIWNCSFENNTAREIGGSLVATDNVVVNISDTQFINNRGVAGGAILLQFSAQAVISNSSFQSNLAKQTGGAIDNYEGTVLSLYSCNLTRNDAITGGAITLDQNCTASIVNCQMVSNKASDSGGAIDLLGSTLSMDSTSTDSNEAVSGGSLHALNSSVTLTHFRLIQNSASKNGGGLHLERSNATLQWTRFQSNKAEENGGGIYAFEGSFVNASDLFLVCNSATELGGGVVILNASYLLCQRCRFERNKASGGGGLYLYSNNSVPIVAQLTDSRFEHNEAESYGGGLEFMTPRNRSTDCRNPNVTCGFVVLLSTEFAENRAKSSGAAILTSDVKRVVATCDYQVTSTESFLSEQELNSLDPVSPKKLCESWTGNRISNDAYAGIIGSYGNQMSLFIASSEEVIFTKSAENGPVLENVSSGRQLPAINITMLDDFGVGPAPTLPNEFEARLFSPDGLFHGLYAATISDGSGYFSNIIGFVPPGNYTLEILAVDTMIESVYLTVIVRGCQIGEQPTQGGELCQQCDALSYNFNPAIPGGCTQCPENGICKGRYIVPEDGYWHVNPCQERLEQCIIAEACSYKGRAETLTDFTQEFSTCELNETELEAYGDELCNEGYEGLLCGSCKKSYGMSTRFRCLKCPRRLVSYIAIFGITFYLFVATSITVYGCLPLDTVSSTHDEPSAETESSNTLPSTSNQDIEMAGINNEAHHSNRDLETEEQSEETHTPDCQQVHKYEITRWKTTEIFKIAINYLQTTAAAATVNLKWKEEFLTFFEFSERVGALTTAGVAQPMDCLASSSSAVMKSTWQMLLGLFVPGSVIGLFIAIWTYFTLRESKSIYYFLKRMFLSFIAVSYISYLGLTKSAIRVFYCVDVYDPSNRAQTKHLAIDTSVECYEKDHYGLIVIASVILAVVTVLFPLLSAVFLIRDKEQLRHRDNWVFETAGFLFRAFKEDFVYWESLVMLRKALLSVIVVFAYPLGGQIQGLLAALVIVLGLYLHQVCAPFRKELSCLNRYESVSLLISCVTFISGQFFNAERSSYAIRILVTVVVIFANISFFAFLLVALVRSVIEQLKAHFEKAIVNSPPDTSWWMALRASITSKISEMCSCKE